MLCIHNHPVYTSLKKIGIVLDDNSGLYTGTLIFGHDENVSTGLSKVRFDEHTIILSELLIN